MNLHPLDDHIVVDPKKPEEVTKGGIVIPERSQRREQFGTVLAVGPGRLLESGSRAALSMKVGDTVVYGRYGAGDPVEIDGKELLVMRASDVLCTVS